MSGLKEKEWCSVVNITILDGEGIPTVEEDYMSDFSGRVRIFRQWQNIRATR